MSKLKDKVAHRNGRFERHRRGHRTPARGRRREGRRQLRFEQERCRQSGRRHRSRWRQGRGGGRQAESAIYSGTKGALDAITGVLSRELGPRGIRVNAVNPGLIETEGTHTAGAMGSDFQSWNVGQTPLGRIGQVQDIAPIVSFPASDDAGWVTGELILGSGGMR